MARHEPKVNQLSILIAIFLVFFNIPISSTPLFITPELKESAKYYFQSIFPSYWYNQSKQVSNNIPDKRPSECGGIFGCDSETDKQEMHHKFLIDTFKERLLKQLRLNAVPKVNRSTWTNIPSVIQERLKARVSLNNEISRKHFETEEEKEALVHLQPEPFRLQSVAAQAFSIKISNLLELNQVLYGYIHAEYTSEITEDLNFELFEYSPPFVNGDILFGASNGDNTESWNREFQIQSSASAIALATPNRQYQHKTLTFEITEHLNRWITIFRRRRKLRNDEPSTKYVLIVCRNCPDTNMPIDSQKVVLDVRYSPVLRRQLRSVEANEVPLTNRCQAGGHHFTCCTEPLTIKFSAIGWDNWIVFPDRVEANYCRGTCEVRGFRSPHYEMLGKLQENNRTEVSQELRDAARSCCYPIQRNDFSVLHVDSNEKVNMLTLHGLIVLGCGCS